MEEKAKAEGEKEYLLLVLFVQKTLDIDELNYLLLAWKAMVSCLGSF